MKRKFNFLDVIMGILIVVLGAPWVTWATGPRLTPQLFEPEATIKIFFYEYPPLTTFEMTNMGICSEIIQEAFTAAGVTVTLENQVVKPLAVYSLIQENAAAMIGMQNDFSDDELKQLVLMPCYTMRGRFFYYKPNHKKELDWYGKLENLKGYTYGALVGEDLTIYKKAGIKTLTVTGDLPALFSNLKDGKIDFLSMADIRGEWFLQKYFPDEKEDFGKMQALSWEAPFSIIFNKKHLRFKELSTAFSKGFKIIKQNGRYDEIIEKRQ